MRILPNVCAAFFAVLLWALPISAHFPEDTVYQAFQFADDQVPRMDGDLSDWDILPPEYIFELQHHTEVRDGLGEAHNTADLHIKRVAVGWNEASNRLYFMAEVADNILLFEKPDDHLDSLNTVNSRQTGAFVHGSDIFEIVLDADHAGERVVGLGSDDVEEMRWRSALAQNYHLYMPPLNGGDYWHWMWGFATWTDDPAYSDVGWRFTGSHGEGGTVTYECYLTPFDDLHPDGPESSQLHDLTEGAIIGLAWAFLDADEGTPRERTVWTLTGNRQMVSNAAFLADFRLMPIDERDFDPAAYPVGSFRMTPEVDLELEPVPLVVPEKFRDLVPGKIDLNLPPGFSAKVFAAEGLEGPRLMDFSPDGVLHVANMKAGGAAVFKPPAGAMSSQIVALPDRDRDGVADEAIISVDGLRWANSLQFSAQGDLYVADTNMLWRFRDGDGDLRYEEREELAPLPSWLEDPSDTQHITRTLVLDEARGKIYVSVGSSCDICRENDPERATVLEFNLDGSGRRIFATGMRNAVGLDLHPISGELWAVNNGHGREGQLLPPEFIDIVRDGGFYGWPLAYPHQVWTDISIDQYRSALGTLTAEDSLLVESMQRPVALVGAHLAPMALHFYTGDSFPPRFRNAGFFALRAGRRAPSPGYKVMALFSEPDGRNARVADFLTGFEPDPLDRGNVWGYPVGVTSDSFGNLYVSSDWETHAILKIVPRSLRAFLEGELPAVALSGRPLSFDAAIRVEGLDAEGEPPLVVADLSDVGGPSRVELMVVDGNLYRLQADLPELEPGLRSLLVRIEQQTPSDRLVGVWRYDIEVAPGEDLVVHGDEFAPGWAVAYGGGIERVPFAGQVEADEGEAALALQVDEEQSSFWFGWRMNFQPEQPQDVEGYSALRFAFHSGDAVLAEGDQFSVTLQPGGTVDLLAEGLAARGGWQQVDIPLERFGLEGRPIEVVRFVGTLKGAFYLDGVRFATSAPVPETAVREERVAEVPESFALEQNAPNPFNSNTVIRFALPAEDEVALEVFNLAGQRVATLVAGPRAAGVYAVQWDGRDQEGRMLASGVYIYRLRTGDRVLSRKLLLLK